jgi:hypothetical protein
VTPGDIGSHLLTVADFRYPDPYSAVPQALGEGNQRYQKFFLGSSENGRLAVRVIMFPTARYEQIAAASGLTPREDMGQIIFLATNCFPPRVTSKLPLPAA